MKRSVFKPFRNTAKTHQKGMSFIEVLVAMLIIGLALAMSISMIQASNRFGESAEFSSSALQQAQAIIDKIKANSLAANTYVFTGGAVINNNGTYEAIYDVIEDIDIDSIPDQLACQSDICTDAENVARNDILQWNNLLQNTIPGGRGIIRRIDILPNVNSFEVIVMWNHNAELEMNNNRDIDGIRVNFSL